jgi:hypothetical protein
MSLSAPNCSSETKMKMIIAALLAVALSATNAGSVNAKGLKAERSDKEARNSGKATRDAAAAPGESFTGRNSLGGSNTIRNRKSNRTPNPSGSDETFDGRKFFDDSVLNGG